MEENNDFIIQTIYAGITGVECNIVFGKIGKR